MSFLKATLILALSLAICARNQENLPTLNKDLQEKLNRYQSDVKTLQEQVQKVKQELEKVKAQPSIGFASVEEGVANQRDLLKTIEGYLTLPFNISSCDCYELNEGQRERILKQISSIKSGLEKLNGASGLDQECKQYVNVKKEIERQRSYIQKVQASLLNSNCAMKLQKKEVSASSQVPSGIANIAQSEYQTNLKAENLCYGKLTQQQVKVLWFAFSVKNNVANCPLSTPFYNGLRCIACEGNTPFFDLSLKRCIAAKGVDSNKQCIDPSFTSEKENQNSSDNNTSTATTYKQVPVEPIFDKPIVKSVTLNKENKTNEKIVEPILGKAIISKQKSVRKVGYEEVDPVESQPLVRIKKTKYTTEYEKVAPLQHEPLRKVVTTSSSRSSTSSSRWSSSSSSSGSLGSSSSSSSSGARVSHLLQELI